MYLQFFLIFMIQYFLFSPVSLNAKSVKMRVMICDQRRKSNESGSITLVSTGHSLKKNSINSTINKIEDYTCSSELSTRPVSSSTVDLESYRTCTEGSQKLGSTLESPMEQNASLKSDASLNVHKDESNKKSTVTTSAITSTPSDVIRRCFARQKQVKELLNTEMIYIQSLTVLNTTYIQGMMADLETPIYFRKFKDSIENMIMSHKKFLEEITRIYILWGKSATSTLDSLENNPITSPDYENFQMPFNEVPYLKNILTLISEKAIDVPYYCTYCSLMSRVLGFSKGKNIEKYKRLSIKIVNDYIVRHAETEMPEYMISQALDTRFISLIQMPTARITRYALIVRSLLDKMKDDDALNEVGTLGERVIDELAEKCLDVNSYIGRAQEKQNKMKLFEQITGGCIEKMMGKLFLDNLGAPEFVGGYGVIWMQNNQLYYEPLAIFLFKTHIVCIKLHQIRGPQVVFLIPLISILNNFRREEIMATKMYTKYPFQIKIRFENRFREHEIVLIFPSNYEMHMWEVKLNQFVQQLKRRLPTQYYPYSNLVQQYYESLESGLPFVLGVSCPNDLDWYKKCGKGEQNPDATIFIVRHFLTRINRCDQREIIMASKELAYKSTILIYIRRDHRTLLEKELGALWSKELPLYHLEGGLFVQSTSMMNLKTKISTETQSLFSHFSLSTQKLKKQKFKESFSSGIRNIVKPHPRIDFATPQIKKRSASHNHLVQKFIGWAKERK